MGSAVAKPQHFRVQREGAKRKKTHHYANPRFATISIHMALPIPNAGIRTSFREMHLDTSSQAKLMFSPPQIVKSPGYSFADHEQVLLLFLLLTF